MTLRTAARTLNARLPVKVAVDPVAALDDLPELGGVNIISVTCSGMLTMGPKLGAD